MEFEYLIIELSLLLLFFLIHRYYKVRIFRTKKQFIVFWILVFLFGIVWDQYAVSQGHWIYPGKGILGIFIGRIPIEDIMFMIVSGYGMLVAYQVSNKMIDFGRNGLKIKKR